MEQVKRTLGEERKKSLGATEEQAQKLSQMETEVGLLRSEKQIMETQMGRKIEENIQLLKQVDQLKDQLTLDKTKTEIALKKYYEQELHSQREGFDAEIQKIQEKIKEVLKQKEIQL